ncbi:amino acid adenylation domain-containing protein [Polymorphospora rubra]|uniref:amino acid adenylation domain-containing protein n=1 Tax=Polymorphospora rubra TaxID=338584 RepID=UPI0033EF9A68
MRSTPLDTVVDDRYNTVTLQPGMLFAHSYEPRSGIDIIQVVVDWPLHLDGPAMESAWQHAVDRHPVLRTAFTWPDEGEPVQEVLPRVTLPVAVLDWTGSGSDRADDRLAAFLADDRAAGVDLATAPLARLALITHGPRRHTLVVTFHHAILDGRSLHMLLDEVVAEYDATTAGQAYEAPQRPAFRDFATWAGTRSTDADQAFWTGRLAGVPLPTALPLADAPVGPGARPDPVRETTLELTAAETAALNEAGTAAGVPLSTLVNAAWAVLLHRYSGSDDVVFGGTRTCRRGTVEGAERMMGLLINTVPLLIRVEPDRPVRDWLADARRQIDAVRPHQVAPLPQIQRWTGLPANTPLFDNLLMYEHRDLQASLHRTIPDWGDRSVRVHRRPAPPITVCVFGEPTVRVLLYHDRRRLTDGAADAMLRQFHTILVGFAAGLDRPVADLPLQDATDRALLTGPWAGLAAPSTPDADYPVAATVPDLVAAQAERRPDAVAVSAPDGELTYRALDERANRLAHLLRAHGVRVDEPVAVALPRSLDLIVTLLAVLKAGGAYLPLDPDDPPARIAQLLAGSGNPPVLATGPVPGVDRVLRLDELAPALAGQPADAPPTRPRPTSLAYISHTSGSTGRPKGVAVPHAAVVRLVHEPGYLRLGPAETVLHLAPVAFDAATLEIWGALANGARLVVAPPGPFGVTELAKLLRNEKISVLWLTAGLFHQVVEFDPESLAGVGQLLAGGDVLAASAVRRALRVRGGAPLVNGYGPTENTTFTCTHVLTDPAAVPDPVPIGRPVPRTTVYVLDDQLRPVPVGVPGDLYTGGDGLARGYVGQAAATAAVFLPDPFDPRPGSRMYRTGDRARWRPDGTLDFLGRADEQVKIRGFRVEPAEVAAVLRDHPHVGDAAVVVDGVGEQRRLLAYVTPRPGAAAPTPDELARHAADRLPGPLRPAAHVVLRTLPLNRNGKVDRRALPVPAAPAADRADCPAPTDPTQTRLAATWAQLLGTPPSGADDDFFALGGNSLLATRLTFAIADRFGVEMPVRVVYERPSLAAMSTAIDEHLARPAVPVEGVVRRDRDRYRMPAPAVPGTPAVPGHLVKPTPGPWAMWRWVGLRAAGFPLDLLTALGDVDLVAAADAVLAAEDHLDAARRDLADRLRRVRAAAPPDERARWNRAVRQGRRDAVPDPLPDGAEEVDGGALVRAHETVVTAYGGLDAARERFDGALRSAAAGRSDALRAAAGDPLFREAVTWQNRHALRTGIDAVRTGAGGTGSKHRQHEALVATYLQRYCVKNDTIGFFGPVGWARVDEQDEPVRVRHGAAPLAKRTVYFENWAVAEAAAALVAREPRLGPWLIPRRLPYLTVIDGQFAMPLTEPTPLPPGVAELLLACDGSRTAQEIATALLAAGTPGLSSPEQVYGLLGEQRDAKRITWSLEVPKEDLFAERVVRARLAAVTDPALREPALAALDELTAARDAVTAAAGDPDALGAALADLEDRFTTLTGSAATRRAGKVYAGRTLVYEDCRSGTQVSLSPELAGTLWPTLSLLLESARWFTFAGAALFRRACTERYQELVKRTGSTSVPFGDFWLWANDLLFDLPEKLIAPVTRALQDRWARILPPAVDHRITTTSAEIHDRAMAEFAAPRPGWMGAYQHSPDVMLAADGPDAIARGDFRWVVGEVHPGVNTLRSALFVAQHPDPEQLRAAMAADLPDQRLVLAATGEEGGAPARITDKLIIGRDVRLVFGHDSGGLDPATAVAVADCVLEPVDGVLTVRSRDGRYRLPLTEVIGEPLMLQMIQRFDILRPADHQPRVTVDRVVLARESWRFTAADLDFARITDEGERFRSVRRWQAGIGLPRHVFVKTPVEKKPFHLDLASLASVDVFCRAVRRTVDGAGDAATLRLSEMLPGPEQSWLTDAEGRRRTAELRLVAVDTRTPGAPTAPATPTTTTAAPSGHPGERPSA